MSKTENLLEKYQNLQQYYYLQEQLLNHINNSLNEFPNDVSWHLRKDNTLADIAEIDHEILLIYQNLIDRKNYDDDLIYLNTLNKIGKINMANLYLSDNKKIQEQINIKTNSLEEAKITNDYILQTILSSEIEYLQDINSNSNKHHKTF